MYKSKILEVIDRTHDTKSIIFEKPPNFNYKAGQYAIFEHKMGNELVRRSYSFSSSPTEDFLEITVKHMPHGKMSGYVTHMQTGEMLEFNGPVGKFIVEENLKELVFIAGGSGISPFRGMIKSVLDTMTDANIIMIYGSRSPQDIILKDELDEFSKNTRFKLFLTVDNPDSNWKLHTGFIDGGFIKKATNDNLDKTFYVCGPKSMVVAVKEALLKLNISENKIIIDAWG